MTPHAEQTALRRAVPDLECMFVAVSSHSVSEFPEAEVDKEL